MPLSRRQKLALWIWWRRHKSKRIRMISVHPINQMRSTLGEYHHLMIQLREDEERFINYFRMGPRSFDKLLEYCRNDLTKKTTHCCVPIPPEERLVVTLRFLATGVSFSSLGFRFRMGFTTVRKIVLETVQVIWARLQATEMPVPTEDTWRVIAKDFFHRWNFPLCLGAIDGKHIRIKAPPNCGSKYFNYKGYHSIVLMAISDAMGRFIVIDVGGYGSSSDSGIIQDSSFFQLLQSNCLNLPQPELISGSTTTAPHVFVADEAFPLMTNILRPFPRRTLTEEKRVFNYRLSRARRQVECAFGILSTMWRVLNTIMSGGS